MRKLVLLSLVSFMIFLSCKEEKIQTVDYNVEIVNAGSNEVEIEGSFTADSEVEKITVIYSDDYEMNEYSSLEANISGDHFSFSIYDLTPNTDYYFYLRFVGENNSIDSDISSFTTQEEIVVELPNVTTKSVSNITHNSAVCGGNVKHDGGSDVFTRGVCWSTTPIPTVSGSHTTSGSGTGEFSCSITNLSPNTKYYVRAYAKNSAGTAYGEAKTFTTTSNNNPVNEWLKYDNGSIDDAIGLTDGGSIYWCSVYPSSMLQDYSGMKLTKVALGVYDETHTGTLYIFIGDEQVHTQSYNANNTNTIMEFTLTTPVTINSSKDLAIMFTNNTGKYVAAYSEITSGNGGNEGTTELFDFEDGALTGWVTIDADYDGYTWRNSKGYLEDSYGYNGSNSFALSQSYINDIGPLNPDNYLVTSRKYAITSDSKISFYACAQDEEYPYEHFGVAVSTTGNTSGSSFTTISEWTINAKGSRQGERGSRQSTWKKYEADLSAYAGKEVYIAIRHFNCTDQYFLDIDDIEINIGNTSADGYNGRWISTDGENWSDVLESIDDVDSWIIRGYVTDSAKGEIMLAPQEFKKNPNAVGGGTFSKSK